MSSSKPKKNRACDSCRRRKSRCNGFDVPGGRCTTCIIHSVECTYNDPPPARNPDRPPPRKVAPKSYVQALEARISNIERLIQNCQLKDAPRTIPNRIGPSICDGESEDDDEPRPRFGTLPPLEYSPSTEAVHSDEEPVAYLETDPDNTSVVKDQDRVRFFGKSSLFVFARQAFGEKGHIYDLSPSMRVRGMEFWDLPNWLTPLLEPPAARFEFPEMSLMLHLVDCYFENLNLILPLLHRPSFMRSVAGGLHEVDQDFGATVLLVCAIGCRYTDHPSVVHELSTSTSCTAWSFYNQVNRIRKPPYLPHSLYEVQIYPLTAMFLESYSPLETSWLIIGTGLRVMQDSGVHRKFFSKKRPLERELWKRAFWVSVVLDRAFSTLLGRSCVLQDEDFDADLPLACDDEDLDDSGLDSPEVNPRAPMCCFVAVIKLNQILAFSLRTIYSTRRSRIILGYAGKNWEKHIVAILDSALNKWADAVPEHLRWGSETPKKSRVEIIQSAFLWAQFYETQVHIHRMFALKEPPDPDLSESSMIICKIASRRCIATMESARDVMIVPLNSFLPLKSLFMSAMFLLIMFSKQRGIDYSSPEFLAIEVGMEMVGQTAKRRRTSLHLLDIAMTLRESIEGPDADRKPTLRNLTRKKYKGAQYIDQDGTLMNEGRIGGANPEADDASMNVPPQLGIMWDGEHQPTTTKNVVHGSEGVLTDNHLSTQPLEFLPFDFFADPSVLFSGPSSTGFTGIGDQCTTGGATSGLLSNDYDMYQFFYGEEAQASTSG